MKNKFFNIFKVLGVALGICAGSFIHYANAASVATSIATNGNYNILSNSVVVYNVNVAAGSTAPVLVEFFDSATTSTNYTNASYATRVSVITNAITTYTQTTGTVISLTNSVLWTYNVTNNAATNRLPVQYSVTVPVNQSYSVPVQLIMTRGVTVTTSTNATITLIYERTLGGITNN